MDILKESPALRSEVASLFASIGGRNGKGAKKRRSKAHYKRMVAIRLANAEKKKKEKKT